MKTTIIVGVVLIVLSARSLIVIHSAARWPTVPGAILEAKAVELDRHVVVDNKPAVRAAEYWGPLVRYAYTVNGQEFVGTQYSNHPPRFPTPEDRSVPVELSRLVASLPVGQVTQVHFDTSNPSRSYLFFRSNSLPYWILAVGAIMALVGSALRLVRFDRHWF